MIELGARERKQAPPPRVVWECLTEPRRPGVRSWLELREGEIEPRIIEAVCPTLVVWSSLWPARPRDVIRFDLRDAGDGCALRWTLLSPDEAPGDALLGHLRHRLNYLINARLRYSFGQ
ncbi:SRPBCC family protein [Sphaerisporangium aureirubrum]|uniref:SRPBCC domain-containing protein n=1 Tax=Sphaerisporangium aureirubrum TaxID=1544736 RepID=A0ABW1N9V7_9ACTN